MEKTDASRFLLIAILILIIVGIAAAVYTLRSNPVDEALSGNRVVNVLFVIEDEKIPLSAYVLMYYPATKRAAIFDIPGELGLLISRINRVDRIDRVYESGRITGYENEIEKLLGIDLNFSIVITKEKLISMVDLLEGVEIFIPSRVSYRDDSQLILFPSGITVLDGDKAGAYATYTLPGEDRELEVFRRQRFFLGLLNSWIRMNDRLKEPAAAKLYYSFFRTDMNQRTLVRLFDEFINIDTERTNIQSVGGSLREVSGQMLIIPHWDGSLVKEIVRQTLGTLTRQTENHLSERTVTVEVLNGTAVSGLAGRTAEMLRSFGYDVISIGNADHSNYESTVIVQRTGDEGMAIAFADIIQCSNIRREFYVPDENEDEQSIQNYKYIADFTLIIGRNFDGRYVTGN
ncbi:MAG: LCP family protein [Treponema sp.]|nr:LCP family protein [Treponema sp.]